MRHRRLKGERPVTLWCMARIYIASRLSTYLSVTQPTNNTESFTSEQRINISVSLKPE